MSEKAQPEAVTPQATEQPTSLDQAPIEALLEELGRLQRFIAAVEAEIIRRTKVK